MLTNDNVIGAYVHCKLCLEELVEQRIRESPQEYARLEMGWTHQGLQVWCVRHDCNVVHIDFEGYRHPANTSCKPSRQH